MSAGPAVLAALGAALAYGAASVCQHREAERSSAAGTVRIRGLFGLLLRPLWLGGIALDGGGLVLQVWALNLGAVSLVQPLLVTTLLFALAIGAVWNRRPLRSGQVAAALSVLAGVILFLAVARPGNSARPLTSGTGVWLDAGVLAGMALLAAATRLLAPGPRGVALGTAAGAGFAVVAVLIGSVARLRNGGSWAVLLHARAVPDLVGILVVGAAAIAANQAAFQVGELAAALPALTMVDPVLAAVLGAALLGERLHSGGVDALGLAGAVGLAALGVVQLARAEAAVSGRPAQEGRPK